MKLLKFNCYAMKKEDEYTAGCITLNLLVYGDSIQGVMEQLDHLIDDHMGIIDDYVKKLDKNEYYKIKPLLNRPAPFFMYADFIKCFIFDTLHLEKIIKTTREFLTFEDIKFIPDNVKIISDLT